MTTGQSAPLPQYSPYALVVAVQRLLGQRGIVTIVDLGDCNTAAIAAADLLRAIGVAPTNAPMRPPTTAAACAEKVVEQEIG